LRAIGTVSRSVFSLRNVSLGAYFPPIWFVPTPQPFDVTDYGLAAFSDIDVLHGDRFLLALATMPIQGFEQSCVGARQLVCLIEILFLETSNGCSEFVARL
jgi:hypothetical protein